MKLYIKNYYYIIDSNRDDDDNWEEDWDFYILSAHNRPKDGSEQVEVDYEVSVGERVYVLYMRYSSGDSFGCANGKAEIIWVFKNKEVAMAAKKIWENANENDMVEIFTDSGKSLKLSNPAAGYFENVSSINLETYIVES